MMRKKGVLVLPFATYLWNPLNPNIHLVQYTLGIFSVVQELGDGSH